MHPEAPTTSAPPTTAPKTYRDVLAALIGKVVTVVNPESFEEAPVGFRLTTGFYKGKVLGLGEDFVRLQTVLKKHAAKSEAEAEPVTQYVPFQRIKRVSVLKSDTLLHL